MAPFRCGADTRSDCLSGHRPRRPRQTVARECLAGIIGTGIRAEVAQCHRRRSRDYEDGDAAARAKRLAGQAARNAEYAVFDRRRIRAFSGSRRRRRPVGAGRYGALGKGPDMESPTRPASRVMAVVMSGGLAAHTGHGRTGPLRVGRALLAFQPGGYRRVASIVSPPGWGAVSRRWRVKNSVRPWPTAVGFWTMRRCPASGMGRRWACGNQD